MSYVNPAIRVDVDYSVNVDAARRATPVPGVARAAPEPPAGTPGSDLQALGYGYWRRGYGLLHIYMAGL